MIYSIDTCKVLIISLSLFMTMNLAAQENDLYKLILKESLEYDLILDHQELNLNPEFSKELIIWDVNKQPLPKLGYNHKLNTFLLHYKDSILSREFTISPFATMRYTNEYIYDPNATETDGEVLTNVILYPLTSIGLLNFNALFDFMIRAGIIPYDDPIISKKSKKERALKTITQDIYHIDD